MASNRSLAEFNLSKQPELEEGKQVLRELSEQANQLCISVRSKIDEMRKSSYILIILTKKDLFLKFCICLQAISLVQ